MSADLNAIKARWAATQAVRRKYPLRTGFGLGMTYGAVFLENAIANHAPGETNDPELREIWEADAEAIAHAPEDIAALVQALEEVREVLADPSLPEYRVAWKRVYDVLERRMGADWLNGRGESE